MKTLSIALTAGAYLQFEFGGNYFRMLETTGPVNVDLIKNGAVVATSLAVEAGYWDKPDAGFGAVGFLSATTQTIKIAINEGTGGMDRPIGSFQEISQQGVFTEGRVSLTNANQAIIAANAARKYLMVQNNDVAKVMRITLDGAAATATRGFRIQPGGSLELTKYIASGSINAFMETATSASNNVEFVTG